MTRRSHRRLPAPEREPIPAFTPVPRRFRHDGWTPERQKAFIEALADTGCVDRAARMVNMAQQNCYTLRRAAGAEEFRRAWDAALDFGLKRLKDIAFERAIEGQLVPVFVAGKLMGFRRKHNDALLMFCLRHYGQDSGGKRTTINYFSSRATSTSSGQASATSSGRAGDSARPHPNPSPEGEGLIAGAEASATVVRTVISGPADPSAGPGQAARMDAAAGVLEGFEGVRLDPEAEAAIAAALEACAARARAANDAYGQGGEEAAAAAEDDPGQSFVRVGEHGSPYRGLLVPAARLEEFVPFADGEPHWSLAGAEKPEWLAALEERREVEARKPALLEEERLGERGALACERAELCSATPHPTPPKRHSRQGSVSFSHKGRRS